MSTHLESLVLIYEKVGMIQACLKNVFCAFSTEPKTAYGPKIIKPTEMILNALDQCLGFIEKTRQNYSSSGAGTKPWKTYHSIANALSPLIGKIQTVFNIQETSETFEKAGLDGLLKKIKEASESSEAILTLIEGMIEKHDPEQKKEFFVSFQNLVESTVKCFLMDSDIKVTISDPHNVKLSSTMGLPDFQSQVLMNLIDNAIDAMEGRLKKEIKIKAAALDKTHFLMVFCDTGAGMPEKIIEEINGNGFTATTKRDGISHGISLGLKQIDDYTKKRGGGFTVESKVGVGTKFFFCIPFKDLESYDNKKDLSNLEPTLT